MNATEVVDVMRDAMWVLITLSAPLMLCALLVGLAISLFQALTQIQEMTLTFVPKMLAIFFMLLLMAPFMVERMENYGESLFVRMTEIGQNDRE